MKLKLHKVIQLQCSNKYCQSNSYHLIRVTVILATNCSTKSRLCIDRPKHIHNSLHCRLMQIHDTKDQLSNNHVFVCSILTSHLLYPCHTLKRQKARCIPFHTSAIGHFRSKKQVNYSINGKDNDTGYNLARYPLLYSNTTQQQLMISVIYTVPQPLSVNIPTVLQHYLAANSKYVHCCIPKLVSSN